MWQLFTYMCIWECVCSCMCVSDNLCNNPIKSALQFHGEFQVFLGYALDSIRSWPYITDRFLNQINEWMNEYIFWFYVVTDIHQLCCILCWLSNPWSVWTVDKTSKHLRVKKPVYAGVSVLLWGSRFKWVSALDLLHKSTNSLRVTFSER